MRHPGLLPDVGGHQSEQGGFGQGFPELATEECGERADRDKLDMIAGREPLGARWRQGSTGHAIMDMRMIGHIPRPGVQDPNHAELSAEELGVQARAFKAAAEVWKSRLYMRCW
jgi:hypothetical protein